MNTLISVTEIHMSVYICHTRGLECVLAIKEAGVYRGHEGSTAVTLSHDA